MYIRYHYRVVCSYSGVTTTRVRELVNPHPPPPKKNTEISRIYYNRRYFSSILKLRTNSKKKKLSVSPLAYRYCYDFLRFFPRAALAADTSRDFYNSYNVAGGIIARREKIALRSAASAGHSACKTRPEVAAKAAARCPRCRKKRVCLRGCSARGLVVGGCVVGDEGPTTKNGGAVTTFYYYKAYEERQRGRRSVYVEKQHRVYVLNTVLQIDFNFTVLKENQFRLHTRWAAGMADRCRFGSRTIIIIII